MNKYVLGVDGGNTKTDYLLFDLKGNYVDSIRKGTISHEALKGGFEESKMLVKEHMDELLLRNNGTLDNIVSSCFGLAGIDTKNQKRKMEVVLKELNFTNYVVYNDGFLPIKIGASNKYGVAVINGTGNVIGGIDANKFCQVGGFGIISSDDAGGSYLVRQVVRLVYSNLYRNKKNTVLTKYLFDLLELNENQKDDFIENAINKVISNRSIHKDIIQQLFLEVKNEDEGAKEIIRVSAVEIANGVVGCINELNLAEIEVMFAGSVFVNCNCEYLFNEIKNEIKKYISKEIKYILVEEAPAIGAILWALELANVPNLKELKQKVILEIKKYQ